MTLNHYCMGSRLLMAEKWLNMTEKMTNPDFGLSNNRQCNTINNHYQLLYKVDFGNPALAIAQILIFGPAWIMNQHTSQVYILKCGSRFDLGQISSASLDLLVTYASSFGIQASSTWFKFLTE